MSHDLDVRALLGSLSASQTVSGSIAVADIRLGECSFALQGPATFTVTVTNTGAGLVVDGEVRATVRTSCTRCLCDFDLAVTAPVDGFFVAPGHEEGVPEEQEVAFIEDGHRIDLEPAVVQALIVELPFAPIHDEGCKGICPVCGADRNVEPCSCEVRPAGGPLAALGELLEHLGEPPADGSR